MNINRLIICFVNLILLKPDQTAVNQTNGYLNMPDIVTGTIRLLFVLVRQGGRREVERLTW